MVIHSRSRRTWAGPEGPEFIPTRSDENMPFLRDRRKSAKYSQRLFPSTQYSVFLSSVPLAFKHVFSHRDGAQTEVTNPARFHPLVCKPLEWGKAAAQRMMERYRRSWNIAHSSSPARITMKIIPIYSASSKTLSVDEESPKCAF